MLKVMVAFAVMQHVLSHVLLASLSSTAWHAKTATALLVSMQAVQRELPHAAAMPSITETSQHLDARPTTARPA